MSYSDHTEAVLSTLSSIANDDPQGDPEGNTDDQKEGSENKKEDKQTMPEPEASID